ncbi:MAG: alginate lyase family protein, partial [Candidatus Latescibacteria bacterium]|nr:alginate lyase family protein [Candidatus Latescibacterota bacterium]
MTFDIRRICLMVFLATIFCTQVHSEEAGMENQYDVPRVVFQKDRKHPVLACTPEELNRFQKTYGSAGEEGDYLAKQKKRVDTWMEKSVVFPSRGKAHNQWYQCDDCQIGLKTLDETHHKCPKCEKVYTGAPYDDVIYGRITGQHFRTALYAGWMYQFTGEKQYAEYTAKILLGYAARYLTYPYHDNQNRVGDKASRSGGRLTEQTLSEASTMVNSIAPCYDLIHDSGVLSPEEHEVIRNQLFVPMLKNIDKNKRGKSNWQSWHNAAMLSGGAVIGDADWVNKAVHQEKHGFLFQMDVSVSGDGFWYENSWGYHFYTLAAQVGLSEGARRLGIDLWHHPAMKKMCTIPAYYTMPDGKLPGFNDSHARRPSAKVLEAAYAVYQDPVILSLLEPEISFETISSGRDVHRSTESVQLKSQLFAATGHAILRTDGAGKFAAILDFASHGGGHGHYDALGFQLYGYEQALGVDRGIAKSQAYRLPIHRNWYKTTISHNTILVDEEARDEGDCELVLYAENDRYAAVVARDGEAYPGVSHQRLLVLTPEYLIVMDDMGAERSRRFNWMYHNYGSKVMAEGMSLDATEAKFRGAEYLEHIKKGVTDQSFQVQFVGEDVTTTLWMVSDSNTQVLTADGPGETVLERIPMAMITREGKSVQFAAVLEAVSNTEKSQVREVSAVQDAEAQTVTVAYGDREDVLVFGADGTLSFTIDGKQV